MNLGPLLTYVGEQRNSQVLSVPPVGKPIERLVDNCVIKVRASCDGLLQGWQCPLQAESSAKKPNRLLKLVLGDAGPDEDHVGPTVRLNALADHLL
mmetsp:Transcript_99045/g.173013  ORF Transcript_99045/g.173013 Transcript_99045/m.173013 type:complete len:96 (+) Transcript_99045:360-647(+)